MPLIDPRSRYEARLSSNVYKGVSGEITGTGTLTLWNPAASKRFILKGWHIVGIVKTTLAASNPVIFSLYDNTSLIAPLFGMEATAPVSVQFESSQNIGDGYLSANTVNNLVLKPNATIGGGVMFIEALVWGEER